MQLIFSLHERGYPYHFFWSNQRDAGINDISVEFVWFAHFGSNDQKIISHDLNRSFNETMIKSVKHEK